MFGLGLSLRGHGGDSDQKERRDFVGCRHPGDKPEAREREK